MKKSQLWLWDSLNFIFCFFFARWCFMNYLESYATQIFSAQSGFLVEVFVNFSLVFIMAVFFFVLIRLIYLKKVNPNHLLLLYIFYFILLIYLLFFKNIGLKGYEFNPLTYFDGVVYGYWFEPVMNLLLFIPTGFLFKLTWKSLGLAILGLLLVETLQYSLHLGIFDVGDLLANFTSLALGQLLRMLLLKLGLRTWLDLDKPAK